MKRSARCILWHIEPSLLYSDQSEQSKTRYSKLTSNPGFGIRCCNITQWESMLVNFDLYFYVKLVPSSGSVGRLAILLDCLTVDASASTLYQLVVMMSQVVVSQKFRLTLIRGQLWAKCFCLPVEDSIIWSQLAHDLNFSQIVRNHFRYLYVSTFCHQTNGCLYPSTWVTGIHIYFTAQIIYNLLSSVKIAIAFNRNHFPVYSYAIYPGDGNYDNDISFNSHHHFQWKPLKVLCTSSQLVEWCMKDQMIGRISLHSVL